MLRSVGAAGQTSLTQYDLNDNPIALTNPRNHSHQRAFDSLNRLVTNTDPLSGITQLEYDVQDNLTQVRDPRGVTTQYQYDGLGNMTQMQRDSVDNHGYSYDPLDRLVGESTAFNRMNYVYDPAGNRTRKALSTLIDSELRVTAGTSYQYGASNNRLTQAGTHSVDFDAAGNLTADRAHRQFSYDEQNRLSEVKIKGAVKARFRYNAFGQRTKKITSQGTTTFIYGLSGELLGEHVFDNQGKKLRSQFYIWLEGVPLGGISVSYGATGAPANSAAFYLHSDHLNTPRIATNAARTKIWEWVSDAFGTKEASGQLEINLRFPGQYYDVETGLHYNYFRDYDPKTGRYMQSYPIGLAGGLNTYSYVMVTR
ncbi:RHS repeat domain-containing protein [Pseudomonas brassicacearum]|uniref:RHS repeat domain-containing protein n=1 Tax=Pseudomonas brassicacearum TaxID=930166 RepID=UPI001E36A264|nr:RHS repeat-associated core domain-containing protein [Pseudomonas brassicacearum]